MAAIRIVNASPTDYPDVLVLNEAEVPHVNSIDALQLARLHDESFSFRIAVDDEGPIGFLLSMAQSASYESLNFRWFQQRYDRFVYIDRVIVAARGRGQGLGRRLYEDLGTLATGNAPRLTCEVNLNPPNPGSIRFHEGLGFAEIGQQDTEGGSKRVCLMACAL